jgi:hypothetical protein
MEPRTIRVTAGPGRTYPVHPSLASGPGATQIFLVAPQVIEVPAGATDVIRALADGDLVEVPATLPTPSSSWTVDTTTPVK